MQIEEATPSATTRPLNKDLRARSQSSNPPRKNLRHTFATVHKPPRHVHESNKDNVVEHNLIPFRIPVNHVFNAIKDQTWSGARLDCSRKTLRDPNPEIIAPSMTRWFIPPSNAEPSSDTSRIWLIRDISESSFSTLNNPRRL